MYPILLQTKYLIIPSWHAVFVLAAISCYFLMQWNEARAQTQIAIHQLNHIYILGYIGIYLGARAYSIIQESEVSSFFEFMTALITPGPLTYYGGFFAAFTLIVSYCYLQKISPLSCLDLCAPPAFFAAGVGRVGCFLNGDDYGLQVLTSPIPWWAVTFPNHEIAVPRYPTQLVEAIVLCSFMMMLIYIHRGIRHLLFCGASGLIAIIFYCIQRFIIEYWRGDPRGEFIFSLSPAQFISLGVGVVAIGIFAYKFVFIRRSLGRISY